jgi:hypothetical protein
MKRLLVCLLLVGVAGCGESAREAVSEVNDGGYESNNDAYPEQQSPTLHLDPAEALKQIARTGQSKIPSDGYKSAYSTYTLLDLQVDVIRTTSLIYPHAGEIVSDWSHILTRDGSQETKRVVVYYKHDGNRWIPVRYNRGGTGGLFPPPLTQELAFETYTGGMSTGNYPLPLHFPPELLIWTPE